MLPSTLQFVIAMIACAINERMHRKLDYTQEEVRVLKEVVRAVKGTGRISFTADQRRRLAVVGKELSPEERRKYCQLVKPATILAWFRQLVAQKYDSTLERKRGRPRKPRDIRKLVIEMARANLGWGYTKIRDALRTGLKIDIGRTTVASTLAEAGIEPAPEREKKRTWKRFMKMHWESLYACDFFSVEVLGVFGTVRYMVFFVIEIKTRTVEIAGIQVDPTGDWMKQVARNLTDPVDGFLRNATIKYECLKHFVFFGERHLRYVVKEFVEHYLAERFHQGIGGQLVRRRLARRTTTGPMTRLFAVRDSALS